MRRPKRPRSRNLRRDWVPQAVDDAAWEDHLRWLALRDVRFSREWLFPPEKRLLKSRQYRLIWERQARFLAAHPGISGGGLFVQNIDFL
jgi:hypothetical protein